MSSEETIKVEYTRFKVKEGKSDKVDEWLNFLNANMHEVLLTLDGERMFVETIFREKTNEEDYLYWYSIQGEGGIDVTESESWIDKKHLEYWYECIDESYKPVNLDTMVVMIQAKIKEKMK